MLEEFINKKEELSKLKKLKYNKEKKEIKEIEMKINIDEESAKFQAELNKLKPMMDKCITLAKSIKKEYLDKDRQIKTKPPDKIMNIIILILLMPDGNINEYTNGS